MGSAAIGDGKGRNPYDERIQAKHSIVAWTQTDIDSLKTAIASGQLIVRSADRMINYRSLDEMKEVLALMEAEVSGSMTAGRRTRRYMTTRRPS